MTIKGSKRMLSSQEEEECPRGRAKFGVGRTRIAERRGPRSGSGYGTKYIHGTQATETYRTIAEYGRVLRGSGEFHGRAGPIGFKPLLAPAIGAKLAIPC